MSKTQERLLEAVKARGLSHADLEKISGVSRSSIQRYATGITKEIPYEKMLKLSAALNVDVLWLMGYDQDNIAEEDRDAIRALAPNLKPKKELPPDVAALNVVLYQIGEIIELTDDGYTLTSAGKISEDDIQFLLDTATGSLRPAVAMLKKRAERELRARLEGKKADG